MPQSKKMVNTSSSLEHRNSPTKSIKQKGALQSKMMPKSSNKKQPVQLNGSSQSQQKSMRNYNNYISNNLNE